MSRNIRVEFNIWDLTDKQQKKIKEILNKEEWTNIEYGDEHICIDTTISYAFNWKKYCENTGINFENLSIAIWELDREPDEYITFEKGGIK